MAKQRPKSRLTPKRQSSIKLQPSIPVKRKSRLKSKQFLKPNAAIMADIQPSLKPKGKPLLLSAQSSKSKAPPKNITTPPFPAPDPVRPGFCCLEVVETSHKANTTVPAYSIDILAFITQLKRMHDSQVIPVKDSWWGGLQSAKFILQMNRGTVIKGERYTRGRSSKAKEHNEKTPGAVEGDIEFRAGRYFVRSEEEAGGFVEVMINDGGVPWEFDNILGVYKEFVCVEKAHEAVVFQIEVWEGKEALGKYSKNE